MLDEFDDFAEPRLRMAPLQDLGSSRAPHRVDRLVSRLYRAASPTLRSRLLSCLLKPLGTLGMCGVAAGAFGSLLYRGGAEGTQAAMSDMARFSSDQMVELARFVEQVSPDALQEFAKLIAEQPVGMAAFSASAAVLLMQLLRQRGLGGALTNEAK